MKLIQASVNYEFLNLFPTTNKSRMDTDDSFVRSGSLNLFAFYIESLSLYTQSLVRQHNHIIRRLMENFQIGELFDSFSENPFVKFAVFVTVVSCTIPVIMFVLFGMTSVIVTFLVFLFIEGTLLALGGLCMLACIISMILVLSILVMILGVFYVLGMKLGLALNRFETSSSLLKALFPSVAQVQLTQGVIMSNSVHQD